MIDSAKSVVNFFSCEWTIKSIFPAKSKNSAEADSIENRTDTLGKFKNNRTDEIVLDKKLICVHDSNQVNGLTRSNLKSHPNEIDFSPFFDALNSSNFTKSAMFIDHFDISSKFSKDLWSLSDNFPSVKIPYRDLSANYVNGFYYITDDEWAQFKNNLQISIHTLVDLSEATELQKHGPLLDICSQLIEKLIAISGYAEAFAGVNELSSEMFSTLKMENRLTTNLGIELRKIEKDYLQAFMGHLAALTLNRSATIHKREGLIELFSKCLGCPSIQLLPDENLKTQKMTQGLEKLRDYINLRNPRQRMNMSAGNTGVAEFIYGYCLKTLLPGLSDRDKYTRKMTEKNQSNEKMIEVAAARNIGGYHFVCDVLTDQGVATFDSVGAKKTLGSSIISEPENLVISEAFYQSCRPVLLENMSVPIQKDNNCYLAAGWLKFCVFIHYFEQSISFN